MLRMLLGILIVTALVGCGVVESGKSQTSATRTFTIDPQLVDCVGVAPMKCMVVNGKYFYDDIDGFTYEEGYRYMIEVSVSHVPKVEIPADGTSIIYRLVKQISKVPAK
ncbi:MAG: DUF4377 domain-containing protein [Amphritea sp.]